MLLYLFGGSFEKQTTVYATFCERRKAVSNMKLRFLFWVKSEKLLYKRLFPSQKELIKIGYTYARHRVLVPVAWVHKLYDYIFKKNRIINEKIDTSILNERIEIMKKLSMID